ncbi:MAG: gliding motility-associated C-terminal domain-containing protein [Bacteroidales bacterium]|nr:gliding motility-associated C-terminal domain-containing protein [Bacteroidales bacterium]
MKKVIAILIVLHLVIYANAQSNLCQRPTTVGNDFWVTFIPNGDVDLASLSLLATGPDNATINVVNPVTNWSITVQHNGGSKTYIQLPQVYQIPSATAWNVGYHITSTSDISLFASNYISDSWDYTNIIPTSRLTTQYLVQDYPNNSPYFGGMALVATEDNTVFTMTLPCQVENLSLPAGSTYTVTLDEGETLALYCGANDGFSGMMVSSNNKPFALFQGHTCGRVGTISSIYGRDHLYEQAIPLDWWGMEFVVTAERDRVEGDQIRITAANDNTIVDIVSLGNNASTTLQAGQTYEFHLLSSSESAYITSTEPVYVCKYLFSYHMGGTYGDPASVNIPPVHNWLCNTTFPVHNLNNDPYSSGFISSGRLFLSLVTYTNIVGSMTLDGQPIPASSFTTVNGTPYSYCRRNISQGAHTLDNSNGSFYATVSGHGEWVAFAFLTGMSLDTIAEYQYDTIDIYDTVCQGHAYNSNGFNISPTQTQPGTLELWRLSGIHHYHLILTVLSNSEADVNEVIFEGDTLSYNGLELTYPGTYVIHLTAANGCDSLVRLHLECVPHIYFTDTTVYRDTVCMGLPYENYGFSVDAATTANAGTLELWRNELVGDTLHYYHLLLTILPHTAIDTEAVIIQGDTLFFADTTLMEAGDYTFTFTAANGCDSTVTLHLTYAVAGISASADGICPGDTLTLTATGTYYFLWAADPPDPDLEAQQGQASVNVSPQQTTTYYLLDAEGHTVAELMVGIDNPPVLCFEVERPFVDFDHPVVYFTDCSEGHATSIWTFSDGVTLTGDKPRRQFHYPLPDSVVVTLTSCNRYLCCVDTTFTVPVCIRSVWFPNIFTPGLETNNRFGCTASFEIVEFELYIYNRQGLLVYHTDDPTALWDGTRNGTPMPQGAYVYYWFAKDAYDFRRNGAGTVTLLR